MSPYGKYIGIQLFGAGLWMVGGVALMANDHGQLVLVWFVICVGIMTTSWWVACPRCGASVYHSSVRNFFAIHRWFRSDGTLPCYRCRLDLKSIYAPDQESATAERPDT